MTCRPTSPEGVHSLGLQHPDSAVHHTFVGLVQTSLRMINTVHAQPSFLLLPFLIEKVKDRRITHLLDHLILVLDEQLHPLDGGGGGLGHARGHAGQHEVLSKPQLLLVSHV